MSSKEEMNFNIRKIQEQVIFNVVKAESNDEIARKIVNGKKESNPTWVINTMKRMEENFDRNNLEKIRMNCQCGYGMEEKLELVKSIMKASSNLKEFATHKSAKTAGLSYSEGELFLQFPFCPCPMLADVEKLETNTWCLCTKGYSKVLFEEAFQCKVEVTLLKSVKMGDDICLQKIIPLGKVNF